MPRRAREKSKTGIYHIMIRGVNRQTIFEDDEDRSKFINILSKSKDKSGFQLYGYCMMGNHVHLLLKEDTESISLIMQRICSSYVLWYNRKYDRLGHLFQERYKSEVVEDEGYLLKVLRYIHQNPIKAGMMSLVEEYKWSSYHEYINKSNIIDTDYILKIFSEEKKIAEEEFKKYINEENKDICLDYEEIHRIGDGDLAKLIEEKYGVKKGFLHLLEREEMDRILRELKKIDGVTIRQLSRVTGVSKYKAERV